MHRIQLFIISQLMEEASLRYSDLRPKTMEAGQFMYHLKKLIEMGYVSKTEDGLYTLSPRGRQFVDQLDTDALKPREHPRLAALVVCQDSERGNLYIRRGVHPFAGWAGFPFIDITIDYEGSLSEFVVKQIKQEIGLDCRLTHRADGYIRLLRKGELEGNLMAHIMVATDVEGDLHPHNQSIDYFWSEQSPEEVERMLPSSVRIIEDLKKHKDFFFFEYEHNIEE